jgi:alkylation response protein AidB-like acyl-CoA dehydrogenase
MANFFTDNDDIRFLLRYYDLGRLAEIMEGDFSDAERFDFAPADATEAVENYHEVLDVIGSVSGDFIAPRAEDIDRQGNILNDDGTVSRAVGMQENIDALGRAQVMGFTLPHRYGGLNFPNFIYTVSNEIVSRADAALMNIYGLQGIAETINAFASEEIKEQYLPGFAEGKSTGAMVLTEPDAGSDLQAVKLRAYQDDQGQWKLHGVKRFITNGCGEVLLVLARSEPDRSGGLGLSLFVCGRGPTVKVRRLEEKLGIHGSPTCELFFNHTPCQLIGERQRGLVTYVMSLMNGARVGIAAQSLGIAEAAYRVARNYAASRKQFGSAIEAFPAVRDLLVEMKMDLEAARTLTYETCWVVDHEYDILRREEAGEVADKAQKKALKQQEKKLKRLAAMLTPMSKYYASEMCNRVASDSIQVLGGSGYMKDYSVERHLRDARITSIYEGTSQLQIIAAVRGVCGQASDTYLAEQEEFPYPDELQPLVEILKIGRGQLNEAIGFVKQQPGTEYMDLYGRKLVDAAIMLIVGHLFLQQGVAEPKWDTDFAPAVPTGSNGAQNEDSLSDNDQNSLGGYRAVQQHKRLLAQRYINQNAPRINMLCEDVMRGDRTSITDYELLAGPVPTL